MVQLRRPSRPAPETVPSDDFPWGMEKSPSGNGDVAVQSTVDQPSSRSSHAGPGSAVRAPGMRAARRIRRFRPVSGDRPKPGGCLQGRRTMSTRSTAAIRARISSLTPSARPFSIFDHVPWLIPQEELNRVCVSNFVSRSSRNSTARWRMTSSIGAGWSRSSYGTPTFDQAPLIQGLPEARRGSPRHEADLADLAVHRSPISQGELSRDVVSAAPTRRGLSSRPFAAPARLAIATIPHALAAGYNRSLTGGRPAKPRFARPPGGPIG